MSEEICKNCKYHFIEEISFDYPQSCCNKENIIGTTEPLLHCKDFEYSKDYIVDLQQENKQLKEQLESKIDLYEDTISYQLGFEKGKEEIKKEISRLKTHIKTIKRNCKRDKAKLRNRIGKAREYIKKHKRKDGFLNLNEWQTRDLLEILGDK